MSANYGPRVSIGIPVYNGENFIREAIDSILNQTFEDFELIISDNASTDQTEAICRAYVDQHKRVSYFRNPQDIGASGNYTRVFEVNENTLRDETFEKWRTVPFLEREGQYWGLPSDEDTAIRELERLRQPGANFIFFAWPSFWWFDHYSQFNHYLRSRSKFSYVQENDHVVAFNLQRELAITDRDESGRVEVG